MGRTYPIHLHLADKTCLVVGGGVVAERKVTGLTAAGARVRVVSLSFTPELQRRAEAGEIETIAAAYEPRFLEDVCLVFAATDDRAVNARVAADAAERRLLVNTADEAAEGDFSVPATVRRGELCLSIATGGNNPMLAARLCEELERRFGPEYGAYVELLGRMRHYIKKSTEDAAARRRALARLLDAEADLRRLLRFGQTEAASALAHDLVAQALEP
jgi:precorrin-2 dehydrogenase/sirohydrochlorin ferrochelatase